MGNAKTATAIILRSVFRGLSQTLLYNPRDITVDDPANLYIVDSNILKRIHTDIIIVRIVNRRKLGFAGDGGAAVDAITCIQATVACDSRGNACIAANNRAVQSPA